MLMTDAMVDAVEPSLQVGEDEVDDRQILFGNLRVAALGDGEVIVAPLAEAGVTIPVVRDDRCAGRNRSLNETAKRLCASVRHDGEPDTTGVAPALALVELRSRLALPDLNGSGDKCLVVDAPALSTGSTPDVARLPRFAVLAELTH